MVIRKETLYSRLLLDRTRNWGNLVGGMERFQVSGAPDLDRMLALSSPSDLLLLKLD